MKKNVGLKSQGKELWVRAVQAKVTGHSWQSMQTLGDETTGDVPFLAMCWCVVCVCVSTPVPKVLSDKERY